MTESPHVLYIAGGQKVTAGCVQNESRDKLINIIYVDITV